MTITQDNYLNIGNLLINEMIGSVTLAIILGIIWISYIGATHRFPATVTIAIIFVYAGFVLSIAFNSLLWIIIMLIMSALIYLLYARMVKQ